MLLLEHSVCHAASETDLQSAKRWISNIKSVKGTLMNQEPVGSTSSYDIVFDGYNAAVMTSKL